MSRKIDVLIRGGMVYDGSLAGPCAADVGISGDRICYVGPSGPEAEKVIEASGLAVCPGFIDTHAHSDFTIMADPRAEGKIFQGITTEINGNCGMSAAPLYDKAAERREGDLRELGIKERWNSLGEYFSLIEKKGLALNFAMLAGHGNLRGSVMGYADKPPSFEEMEGMKALLRDTISDGAIGMSTGLIYPPGIYSTTAELVELSKVLREDKLIYTSHMRSEGPTLVESVQEVLRIGREAGIRVHVSHIKTAGQDNWQKAEKVISLLDEGRLAGSEISCDRYPYIASSTDLDILLPAWTYAGGNDEELRRISDSGERAKIAAEIKKQAASDDYWDRIIVSSVANSRNRWMEGKTLSAISRELGKDEIETLFFVLIEEKLRVGAIFLSMNEDNLRKFLKLPFCMIGSDSSARCYDGPTKIGKPHPRTFGTFPRLFRMVREERLLSLTEAVHKSTLLAAETFGLKHRGRIGVDMYADLVIFNPATIVDCATFEDPFRRPDGIGYVLVNGIPAVWEGKKTGHTTGRVLRKNGC